MSETTTLSVDGSVVGTMVLDAAHNSTELLVEVANKGKHKYQLSGVSVYSINSKRVEYSEYGAGTLDVSTDDMRYYVVSHATGANQLQFALQTAPP